jgi:hypothetical protein
VNEVTAVIAQGMTVTEIELLAVVATGLPLMVAVKLLLVIQLEALTEALLTLVATIVIEDPETETVAEFPVGQLLSHE